MCSSVMSSTNAIASPVDFISGPSSFVTSGNLSHEKTGSLTAKPVSVDSSSPASRKVWILAPIISFAPIRAMGTPVALATNGTVRDARGLASIT